MKQIQCIPANAPHQRVCCVEIEEDAAPASWEVVVNIEAFPIGQVDLDLLTGQGNALPGNDSLLATRSLGCEAIGRVSQCGTSIRGFSPGDRVLLLSNGNNWTETRRVPESALYKLPVQSELLQLSQLKIAPVTASLLLDAYVSLIEGDWYLHDQPLSCVGRCLLQLGHQRGLRSVNIVPDLESGERVVEQGGSLVLSPAVDLSKRIEAVVGSHRVQLALLGSRESETSSWIDYLQDCLAQNARVVCYGSHCDLANRLTVSDTESKSAFGDVAVEYLAPETALLKLAAAERFALLDKLVNMIVQERLHLAVADVFPIHEIQSAVARALQVTDAGAVIVTTSHCRDY